MRVLLDAKDLIGVLERGAPFGRDVLLRALDGGGHQLVVTFVLVLELARPLLHRGASTNVMSLLSQLETLPLAFLAQPRVAPLEYREASAAFEAQREWRAVDPYVPRFDATFPPQGASPTRWFLHHSIAETVWTIWTEEPGALEWGERTLKAMREQMRRDRGLANPPRESVHFREKVRRDLRLYRIRVAEDKVDELADWIWADPRRCPSQRLGYELYHEIRKNVGDLTDDGDLGDLAHAACLPYVDCLTLDRRMADYVRRATHGHHGKLTGRVARNATDVLKVLVRGDVVDAE